MFYPNHKFGIAEYIPIDEEMYWRLIERLTYLSRTRPHITYAISVINPLMHNPNKVNLQAAYKNIVLPKIIT